MKSVLCIFFLLITLAGCSTTRSLRIESTPAGAEVTLANKVLGVTPLEINDSSLTEEFREGFLTLKISKAEYEDRLIAVPTKGLNTFKVVLNPLDQTYFETVLLKQFQRPQNQLVRELLQIQGLLFAQKNGEAETRLETFIKTYPNIAASYVLQANLYVAKGDSTKAKLSLQRALSLDPQDAVVRRMLENFSGSKTQ